MAHMSSQTWQRDDFYITTDSSSIPLQQLNELFGQEDFSWGKPLAESQLRAMMDASVCFALFKGHPSAADPQLIGLGRWITDHVTVVYVNDIYINQEYRGMGLARWMLECMDDKLKMLPDLRGTIMIVEKDTPTEQLYRKHFAMEDLAAPSILLDRKGPGSTS